MPEARTFNPKRFGARLRQELERTGLDVKGLQVAVRARIGKARGTSYGSIWSYVNGEAPQEPRREVVEGMASVLRVRPDYLMFGGPRTVAQLAAEQDPNDPDPWGDEIKGPADPVTLRARTLFLNVLAAAKRLPVGSNAEEAFRWYYYDLLDHRGYDVTSDDDQSGVPTTEEGIAALLCQRFPRTIAASLRVDQFSSNAILFSELAAAYALDFMASPAPWNEGDELDQLRSTAEHAEEED